jgi:hypothetical protein
VLELIGKAIGTPAQPQTRSFGGALLLVGSFLLIPWILICLTGFGIGFAIRNRIQKPPARSLPVNEVTSPELANTHPILTPLPISFPVQPVMEGISADGNLRYEHRQGEFINAGTIRFRSALSLSTRQPARPWWIVRAGLEARLRPSLMAVFFSIFGKTSSNRFSGSTA